MKQFYEVIKDIFKWLVAFAGLSCMLILSNPDTKEFYNAISNKKDNSENASVNRSIGMKIYFVDPLMEIKNVSQQIR